MPSPKPKTAVLLIAHGSRQAAANQDLVELARLVSDRGGFENVQVAYLELAEPDIFSAGQTCVRQGASRILMLPYFLSAGVHVVSDLQKHRNELAQEFPDVDFVLCPHLGLHPIMVEIVLSRLHEGTEMATSSSERLA